MLAKIALAVALVLTLSAPAPARPYQRAQAEPAEARELAQPTATPVNLAEWMTAVATVPAPTSTPLPIGYP